MVASRRREESKGIEEEGDGYGNAGPPSPSSSGYATSNTSSIASNAGTPCGIEEPICPCGDSFSSADKRLRRPGHAPAAASKVLILLLLMLLRPE
ncbi:hypothetical protein ZWY2020_054464 [Hordeum vulgare]|nr:hypothetical protein ZWY2020_054464 [Hordeum vulgare]